MPVELDQPQPKLMKFIYNWVDSLPTAPVPVIDLASGYGIEARELASKGIACTCQDASWAMINGAVAKVNYGRAEELAGYPENHFGGALLKDAWVFLSPNQRQKMLQGLKHILVPGGSLLIASETLDVFGIDYIPSGLHAACHQSLTCQSFSELEFYFGRLAKENVNVQAITYRSTVADTKTYAKQSGFAFQLLKQYYESDPLAWESRWFREPRAGFVAVLTKNGSILPQENAL